MLIGSRSTAAMVLALCAAAGVTVTAAGCGGPPAASASPQGAKAAKSGKASKASNPVPANVISCLNSHGMSVPAGATTQQVRSAFNALPVTRQQSTYNACGSLFPAKLRQKIQARLTATPSAS
jgi:hypothetical protein